MNVTKEGTSEALVVKVTKKDVAKVVMKETLMVRVAREAMAKT